MKWGVRLFQGWMSFESSLLRGLGRPADCSISSNLVSPVPPTLLFSGATSSLCVRPARAPPADLRFFQDLCETRCQIQLR